jgi:hypothetical protein
VTPSEVRVGRVVGTGCAVPDRERKPEPWQTGAPAPFLTLERARGTVELWAHGSDRFTVRAPEREQLVVGFEQARQTARELADRLDA